MLEKKYGPKDISSKRKNKEALQKRMGLPPEDVPLLGTVGRMTHQKGTDLILDEAPWIAERGQLVILGSGQRALEERAQALAKRYPGRIAVRVGFSEELAHLLEAGVDIFLMPSRFEPCGLNQMYSQRYGTPPVARATGGLADTVEDGVTGFLFRDELREGVGRALACYAEAASWRAMQRAGMARDFSWSAAARRYAGLYSRLATLQAA